MSIYHKIIELSTLFRGLSQNLQLVKMFSMVVSLDINIYGNIIRKFLTGSITIVSIVSIALNFLFPHVVLANNIVGKNVLTFSYPEKIIVLPLALGKNSITLAKVVNTAIDKETKKAYMLPVQETIEKSNDQIAEYICEKAGVGKLPCWQDLRAMREKESYNGKVMTGDNGRSRGWYHIQVKLHRISDECALDFECSTEWTVKNLITNGYKTNRLYAISRHNGGGKMAQIYARSVVYNSAKLE